MNTITLQEAKEAKNALVEALSAALSEFTDKTGLRVESVAISSPFADMDYRQYGVMMAETLAYNTLTKQYVLPKASYNVDVNIPM
jgi:phenylpyruvate tautomerase PptA (4-oxalocrotonate tautomerase family)